MVNAKRPIRGLIVSSQPAARSARPNHCFPSDGFFRCWHTRIRHWKQPSRAGSGAPHLAPTVPANRRTQTRGGDNRQLCRPRRPIGDTDMDAVLQEGLTDLTRHGNSFGSTPEARANWTRHMGFPVKDRVIEMRRKLREPVALAAGKPAHPVFGLPGGVSKPLTIEDAARFREAAGEAINFARFTLDLLEKLVLANSAYRDLILSDPFTHRTYYLGIKLPEAVPREGVGVVEAPRGTLIHHYPHRRARPDPIGQPDCGHTEQRRAHRHERREGRQESDSGRKRTGRTPEHGGDGVPPLRPLPGVRDSCAFRAHADPDPLAQSARRAGCRIEARL